MAKTPGPTGTAKAHKCGTAGKVLTVKRLHDPGADPPAHSKNTANLGAAGRK